ncbi:hypothetical protein BH09PLA1_BH09PLA1_30620 [soil metagenome]
MRISILILAAALLGCRDNTPPPQRVPVPAQDRRDRARVYQRDETKPLPPDATAENRGRENRPPYDDAPIVNQRPPEQRAFVDSYRQVGSPRITLFVNRTLEGSIVPVNPDEPIARAEVRRRSAKDGDSSGTAEIYLRRGQYDEVDAKSLDYQAIETIMTDWLASNGQVTIISPTMARQRLSDQQVKELQEGRPTALSEIARQLDADILIQVQAHPTRQTSDGLEVRIIAEAMNTKGGQSIGRAVVDVSPPLQKTTINRSTRFLARKLMDDMIQTWSAPPPPVVRDALNPPPPPERETVAPPPAPTRAPEPIREVTPPSTQP